MTDLPRARRRLVESLRARGVADERVLSAMEAVPRHCFVPEALRGQAYGDHALPIGEGQSISQPLTVARMLEAMDLMGGERVLEVGTGSGYQTALLSKLVRRVYSIERIRALAARAEKLLAELGCRNVLVQVADGTAGWKAQSPFDAIVVTAGGPSVPPALVEQLAKGGRLVVPVGDRASQVLTRVRRQGGRVVTEELGRARFVDLVGADGWPQEERGR
jgi:protein-L-isoaspartate(D-aspartate) O-methyltransferase